VSHDELRWLKDVLARARGAPEKVFQSLTTKAGFPEADRRRALDEELGRLSQVLDPARFPGDTETQTAARRIAAELLALHAAALQPPGQPRPVTTQGFTVTTPRGTYAVESSLAEGELCQVYVGRCRDGEHAGERFVLKLARDPADNDLVTDEARALQLLATGGGPQCKQLPALLDQLAVDGRAGNILRHIEGVDLVTVRERFPDGVPPRHAVWMVRRLLSVVGYAHSVGILHANIEPSHVLVRGRDHFVGLIDWSYAVIEPGRTGMGFKVRNPLYSPPEVAERKPPIPSSDLFSVGKVMIHLLGGDAAAGTMPASIDERLQRFVQFLLRPSAIQRAQDAWETFEELKELRTAIWGPVSFEELDI
jgi:serine/threonine protein kinase